MMSKDHCKVYYMRIPLKTNDYSAISNPTKLGFCVLIMFYFLRVGEENNQMALFLSTHFVRPPVEMSRNMSCNSWRSTPVHTVELRYIFYMWKIT